MSELLAPTKVDPLDAEHARILDRDGFILLRGAVPEAWRETLRSRLSDAPRPQIWTATVVTAEICTNRPNSAGPSARARIAKVTSCDRAADAREPLDSK